MTAPAAIAAQLVDVRNVGMHQAVKLTLHVPAEQAALVFDAFGWPTMQHPVPVALARLIAGAEPVPQPAADSASSAAQTQEMCDRVTNVAPNLHGNESPPVVDKPSGAVKRKWDELPYAQQAAIRCSEPEFQDWVHQADADGAAAWVRNHCWVESRKQILPETPAGDRWRNLDSSYQLWKAGAR